MADSQDELQRACGPLSNKEERAAVSSGSGSSESPSSNNIAAKTD